MKIYFLQVKGKSERDCYMSSKLIRGTFILTVGMVLSKILGLFYVIPFNQIVGKEGMALYGFAYIPYTIFISISTGGIPLAVAKFVAKYNAMGEYAVGRKLFESSRKIMMLTGITAFLIMYVSAPGLAAMMDTQKFSVEDVTSVIRAVSFALILVPSQSILRGFFQGNESMGPTAVSQVIEQIARIIFLLGGAYIVLNLMGGDVVQAMSVATFSAFIGAVFGFLVLLWYWKKRKRHLDKLLSESKNEIDISLKEIYKEIIVSSIPFIFVGLAMPLFQLVDTVTFNRAMVSIGEKATTDVAFGVLNVSTQKLVLIPMTLATAFSLSIVPSVTKSFVEKNWKLYKQQLTETFQTLLFILIPAVVGISVLSESVYGSFYGFLDLGSEVLRVYAPVAILFALFSVTAAIMQGISQQRFTVLSLLTGILIKLSLNIPFIKMFETNGAVYATAIGYTVSTLINLYVIYYFTGYRIKSVLRRGLLSLIFAGVMALVVWSLDQVLSSWIGSKGQMDAVFRVAITVPVGVLIYFFLSIKSGLLHVIFGERTDGLLRKLKLSRFTRGN